MIDDGRRRGSIGSSSDAQGQAEGAVAAVVTASVGGDPAVVVAAASEAYDYRKV